MYMPELMVTPRPWLPSYPELLPETNAVGFLTGKTVMYF